MMLRMPPKRLVILVMKKEKLELYRYLISSASYAAAPELPAMSNGNE
jgi:hypothetical protein